MNHQSIRNVLVPVDLSEASVNALDIAAQIVKKHKAVLHLLIIEEPSYTKRKEALYDSGGDGSAHISDLLSSISDRYGIAPGVITKKGHVTETILDTAKSEKADLIVIGTHGESGFRKHFTGSNAYNVIKYSTVPVLSIPVKQKTYDFKNVLLPVRAASGISMRYDLISALLSDASTLEILGIGDSNGAAHPDELDRIANEIREATANENTDININLNLNTTWDIQSTISRDIFRFAQLRDAELIIITPGLDEVTRKGFIGPDVQRIISSSELPVLTIKMAEVPQLA